ncbi:hypothetical protein SDC9_177088 [bioreactor metagenome]|uniref:Uncharacterized protein n=1 Tax=bioreactor metagenome TaxID=1076179 RepID=A0A645GSC0_9ZZZZ
MGVSHVKGCAFPAHIQLEIDRLCAGGQDLPGPDHAIPLGWQNVRRQEEIPPRGESQSVLACFKAERGQAGRAPEQGTHPAFRGHLAQAEEETLVELRVVPAEVQTL